MVRALLIVALGAAGCLRTTQFHCANDVECTSGGHTGVCQATGYCSFADPGCTSGQRYGSLSGEVAGQCVTGVPLDAPPDAYPDAPPGFYRVGGTASGVRAPGMVLQNNGGDDLSVNMTGPFQFATPLMTGQTYSVTVKTPPFNQLCVVGFANGTISGADVTAVGVNCTGDPGIACGSSFCTAMVETCCNPNLPSPTCGTTCTGAKMTCDDTADCPSGQICCAKITMQGAWQQSTCTTTCSSPSLHMCDPTVSNPCGAVAGTTCRQMSQLPTGYYACQP